MLSNLSRREFAILGISAAFVAATPLRLTAMTVDQADALVGKLIGEINGVINSGKSESAMYSSFEDIFARYADVNYIAQSALGPAGRSASAAQKAAFTKAYTRYLSVKYGKRFREFIGGKIGLHPVLLLLSLFVFGYFLGFIGLLIAIPAVFVFNYFTSYIDSFVVDMDETSSELLSYVLREGRKAA